MRVLNLYTTLGCHLCDEAADMIREQNFPDIKLLTIEISESERLLADYGVRIPVLKFQDSTKELAWPFNATELSIFLAN